MKLTSSSIISGSVSSSQAILALFFSPPEIPRTNISPITESTRTTRRTTVSQNNVKNCSSTFIGVPPMWVLKIKYKNGIHEGRKTTVKMWRGALELCHRPTCKKNSNRIEKVEDLPKEMKGYHRTAST